MPPRKASPSKLRAEVEIAELIVQLARTGADDGLGSELKLSQWMALRYFGRANRFSRTVSAFAHYQGTTRGTASHTLKVLVTRGYLSRQADERDHRSFRLELSGQARRLLQTDPLAHLVEATRILSADQRVAMVSGLEAVLLSLQDRLGTPLFGTCASCRHLGKARLCAARPFECTLLREPLSRAETAEICVNYGAADNQV